jgi:hypothetical protein
MDFIIIPAPLRKRKKSQYFGSSLRYNSIPKDLNFREEDFTNNLFKNEIMF